MPYFLELEKPGRKMSYLNCIPKDEANLNEISIFFHQSYSLNKQKNFGCINMHLG